MQNRGVIPLFIWAPRLGPNLCLYYPQDLRQTFIYWPPGLRSLPRPPSSGRPLPEPLSPSERICIEQQCVLPGQWPVSGGTGPFAQAAHGYRRMWPSGGEGAAPAWSWQPGASPRRPKQQMHRSLDLSFHTNERTWQETPGLKKPLRSGLTCRTGLPAAEPRGGHFQSS